MCGEEPKEMFVEVERKKTLKEQEKNGYDRKRREKW